MADAPSTTLEGPAVDWEAAVFDTPLARVPRGLHLNAAGDVTVVSHDGSVVTMTLTAGQHALRPVRINSSGTTLLAAQIILLF